MCAIRQECSDSARSLTTFRPLISVDMAQIGIKTYSPYFEGLDDYNGVSSPHPGTDTTSYIGLSAIRQKIAELPVAQQDGSATRGNEVRNSTHHGFVIIFFTLTSVNFVTPVAAWPAQTQHGVLPRVQGRGLLWHSSRRY